MVIIFYLVGIKGTGMSALAIALSKLGEEVIGSDVDKHYFTEENLFKNKIRVLSFSEENIIKYQNAVFIIGHSFDENNEEVKTIFSNNNKYYYYSDFINNYFMSPKIGVSGTHGKTTTTSLLSHFLSNEKIASIIGDGTGYGDPNYNFFIFEACEYKLHFLNYDFDYLIITNIEYDHPDFYNNIDEVISAFQKAANKAKVLIKNNDDINSHKINHPQVITYGIKEKSDIKGEIIEETTKGFLFRVTINNQDYMFEIPFGGKHMLYNFLAALASYYITHNDISIIQDKITNFIFPKRRQEEYQKGTNIIIDDYAHHPTEVKATIEAIKQKYPNKNITVVFQPHTYSRTIFLDKEFQKCFPDYCNVYIAPTFTSTREEKDLMKDKIVNSVFENFHSYNDETIDYLKQKENSIIIFMGAGDIHNELKHLLY